MIYIDCGGRCKNNFKFDLTTLQDTNNANQLLQKYDQTLVTAWLKVQPYLNDTQTLTNDLILGFYRVLVDLKLV